MIDKELVIFEDNHNVIVRFPPIHEDPSASLVKREVWCFGSVDR